MFKDESLNLWHLEGGLAGVIHLCPNCYQRVEATAWGFHAKSVEKNKRIKKSLWRGARNHLFPCWCLSRRIQMSEKLYISVLSSFGWGGVRTGGREGWVGGWVLSHLLALLAVYPHVLAILLCKLCIQGFAVHVRTVRVHTNTDSYLCPSPRAGYLHRNEMKWEMKLESECLSECFFFFNIPRVLT